MPEDTFKSYLGIVMQMMDGDLLRFEAQDADSGARILDAVHRMKIFSEKYIMLSDEKSMTSITTQSVCWIRFDTRQPMEWDYHPQIKKVELISAAQFKEGLRKEVPEARNDLESNIPGIPIHVYAEFHFNHGDPLYFKIYTQTHVRLDNVRVANLLREMTTFPAVSSEGGGILVNMANALHWTTHPAPPDLPNTTWKVTSEM